MGKRKFFEGQHYIEIGGIFLCITDVKCEYYSPKLDNIVHHISRTHGSKNRKRKIREGKNLTGLRKRARSNVVSAANLMKKEGSLFAIQTVVDTTSQPFLFMTSFDTSNKISKNLTRPYYGHVYILYKVASDAVDSGLHDMIQNYKCSPESNAVYIYCGTTETSRPCLSLRSEGSVLSVKMGEGYTCYEACIAFREGSTEYNKYQAFYWAHFWKTLSIYKDMVATPTGLQFKILNASLHCKGDFEGDLQVEDKAVAATLALSGKELFPFPEHLLPQNKQMLFKHFNLS